MRIPLEGSGSLLPRKPPGIPVGRLVILVALLLMAGGAIFFWRWEGTRRRQLSLPPGARVPQAEDDFAPPIQPDRPIRLPPALAASIHEDTGLQRAMIEEEAYYELLSQVVNRSPRFLREVLGYKRADYDRLVKEPHKYRGQTFYVRGVLKAVGERDLDRPVGDYRHVYFGVIEDAEGHPFWFETFAFDEAELYRLGQVAIAEGVFFKIYKYIRVPGTPYDLEGLPDQLDKLPLLICKSVRRSYWLQKVTHLDKRVVRKAAWLTLADRRELEPEPFYHVLSYLKNLDPAQIPKNIPEYHDLADRLSAPKYVARFQGEWVRFWGRLGPVYKHLNPENPAGVTHHYRAYIQSSSGRLIVAFVLEKPEGLKPFEDYVEVRGIFFKPWIYETEKGDEVQVPLVLARALERKRFPPNPWTGLAALVTVLLGVGVALVAWVVYRDRRAQRRFLEERIRRRRRLRAGRVGSRGVRG